MVSEKILPVPAACGGAGCRIRPAPHSSGGVSCTCRFDAHGKSMANACVKARDARGFAKSQYWQTMAGARERLTAMPTAMCCVII
ncbi:hypothetical protein TAL182_CH04426 [Rhizobium sp. TAL182]|nr:hypothetical protein TAL182_CH04426 [Rhizobium sp. TAL182]